MDKDLTILVADDEENDATLLQRAFLKNGIVNPVQVCRDGQQAIEYLSGTGAYSNRKLHPFPSVLFLDLKMPRKNGLDVLHWLKAHPECHVIPVIMLTSSREETDIATAYNLGANSYIVKPLDFKEFRNMIKTVYDYWTWCERPKMPAHC